MDLAKHYRHRNRRFDARFLTEMHVSTYLNDRPTQGYSLDISEHGLFLHTLVQDPHIPFTPLGLEFSLPGIRESIWAFGETRRDVVDDHFYGVGIRFLRMAERHRRMLIEYCLRERARRPYI